MFTVQMNISISSLLLETGLRMRKHAFIPVLVFLLAGCGGEADPSAGINLVPVSGSLLFKGQPAAGAMLIFHPEGQDEDNHAIRPSAVTDVEGRFELTSFENGDGAPPGKYNVAVIWELEPEASGGFSSLGQDKANGDTLLNRKYASPDTSELTAVVASTPTELLPFELH